MNPSFSRIGLIAILSVLLLGTTLTSVGAMQPNASTVPLPDDAQQITVIEPVDSQSEQRVSYTPLAGNVLNPERGFYVQSTPLKVGGERTDQSVDRLLRLKAEDGVTMVRWYFVLDTYLTRDLDADILAYIESQFTNARTAGMKVIPRFTYNYGLELDAPLERTLAHMEQLTPLIQRNSDIIAFVEAGWVGKWGEWHSSPNGHFNQAVANPSARTVLDRWLEILPESRMIALRFVRHKQQFFGTTPLNSTNAHNGSDMARIGAHNDCFLYNDHNRGTYNGNDLSIAQNRAYLHTDNLYVPQGGETCGSGSDPSEPALMACSNALADLAYLRYSTLNTVYHPDSLQTWRNQGCYDEIAARLGYRFVLSSLTSANAVRVGGHLPIALNMRNEGFAAPYNPRDVRVVLRNAAGQTWSLEPQNVLDPRFWQPGSFTLDLSVQLPNGLPADDYEILLHLPDPEASLANRPDYAIRMANANTWEASTGYNRLLAQVTVTNNVPQPQTTSTCPGVAGSGPRSDDAPRAPQNLCVDVRQGQPLLVWSDDRNAQWFNVYILGPNGGVPVRNLWYSKFGALGSTNNLALAACNGNICSLPIPANYPMNNGGGDYTVWMRAWGAPNGVGISGQYSKGGSASSQGQIYEEFNTATFTLSGEQPALPDQINIAGANSGQPTFTWQAPDGVLWYQIWVGGNGTTPYLLNWTFAEDLGCITRGSTCTFQVPTTLAQGTYDMWFNSWGPGGFNQVEEEISQGWAQITQFTVNN